MMKLLKLLGLLLLPSLSRAASRWSPDNYPNPLNNITSCGRRGVSSWVCDPDGVISYDSANVVEGIIKKIYSGEVPYALGPCGSYGLQGYQVAVALMGRMRYVGDASEAAENFARSLHDRWGVGDARCNNGVLLLISVDDRQIFISVGSGATSRLTYDALGDIISDVRPALKDRRYDEAVERAVVDIGLALAGRPVEPEGSEGRWWDELLGLGIFASVVGGFIFVAARTESRKRKRYHDCKAKLEKLKRDQAAARSNTYNPTSCPVCLEDFTDNGNGEQRPDGAVGGTGNDGASGGSSEVQMGASDNGGGGGSPLCDNDSFKDRTHHHQHQQKEEQEIRKPLLGQVSGAGASAGSYPGGEAPSAPQLPAEQSSGEAQLPSQQQQQQRRPLVLPCGHAFCEPCITLWLEQKKVTCPICRKPFDEEDSSPAPNDPRDATLPRPPPLRPDAANRANANPGSGAGPSTSYSGSPRPPCSVDDEPYSYVSPSYSSGVGTVPRLRLRWGSRRRPVRMHEDLLLAEMMFRLRQLQRQHPDYISSSMLHSWEQDLQNGREFNAQQLRQFQLEDPAMRRELASSGSSGTGVGFGGGSSRGGGGRGGSW